MRLTMMAAGVCLALAAPAGAQDKTFDATDPANIAAALKDAGYKAELKTNAQGEPYIVSAAKRFLKLRIDNDGDLALSMDVSGVGRMTQAQFADWVDWYQVMDGELDKFLSEKRAASAPAAKQ